MAREPISPKTSITLSQGMLGASLREMNTSPLMDTASDDAPVNSLLNADRQPQFSVFGSALPGTEAARQKRRAHPLTVEAMRNYSADFDIDGGTLAKQKALSEATNMPLALIQKASPDKIVQMAGWQNHRAILAKTTATREKMAVNREVAAILRDEIPLMYASERAVNQMRAAMLAEEPPGWMETNVDLAAGRLELAKYGALYKAAAATRDISTMSFSEIISHSYEPEDAVDALINAPVSSDPTLRAFQVMSVPLRAADFIQDTLDAAAGFATRLFVDKSDTQKLQESAKEFLTNQLKSMQSFEQLPRTEGEALVIQEAKKLSGLPLDEQLVGFLKIIAEHPGSVTSFATGQMVQQGPVLATSMVVSRFHPTLGMTIATSGAAGQEFFSLSREKIETVKKETGVDISTPEGVNEAATNPDVKAAIQKFDKGRAIGVGLGQAIGYGALRHIGRLNRGHLTKFALATASETVTEGGGEWFAQLLSGQKIDTVEIGLEILGGINPASVVGEAVISGAGDIKRRTDAKKATAWLKGQQDLQGNLQGVPVEKLSTAADVMAAKLEEDGIDTIYIPAEEVIRFDQDGSLAETLGLEANTLRDAAAEGNDVEIDTATYIRHILGKQGFEQLLEHTRFDIEGMTAREAADYETSGIAEEADNIEQQLQARALARIAPSVGESTLEKLTNDTNKIRATVAERIIATGTHNDRRADLLGQLTAQRYAARAIRLTEETGQPVDALALFEADNLRIEGERQAGGVPAGTFFSGTPTPVKAPLEGVNYVRTGPESWVAELDGEQIGRISVIEGAGYVDAVQIFDEKYKRKGIATELYKQVEKDIGRRLFPSPTGIFPDAMGFWKNRLAQMPREEAQALLDESVRVSESKFPKGVPKSIQSNLDELRKTLSFEQEHLEGEPEFIFNQDAPHGDYVNSVSELKNPVNNRKVGPIYRPVAKKDIPKKTRTVYKLMKTFPSRPGVLYPLYAKPQDGVQGYTFGEWYLAESQRPAIGGKDLALRPGIHAVVNPVFDQGKAGAKGPPRVWVEVEVPAISAKTQKESDASPVLANGMRSGITDRLIGPKESYDYKTNPNASTDAGGWPITGSMRAVRVVPNSEIETVLREAGLEHQIENSMSRLSDDEVTALNAQMEKVAAALNPEIREQAEEYAATSFEQAPTFAQDVFDADQLYNEAALSDDGNHTHRISSRLPTTKQAQEDPVATPLTVDLASMKADREKFEYNMQLIAGQLMPDPAYAGFTTNETDPDAIAEAFIEHVVDNLLWLHDQVPAETRERSRQWYVGARAVTTRLAKQYNMPDQAVAAVMAALSPQKDWFQNASLGERVIDIHEKFTRGNRAGERLDKAGIDFLMEKFGNAKNKKTGQYRYRDMIESMAKTPYDKLETTTAKAMWLRAWDETHNPRGYRVLTPEGDWVGKAEGKAGWGSLVEIGKAIEALEDASFENLTKTMGSKNKVRNFYNNILSPHNEYGDVTIDTHAVAAALLRPLAGGSTEVHHNFGSSPEKKKQPEGWVAAKNNNNTGAHGTYGIYAEAYRRAAEARGVEAREMQSITWEAVRGLFTAKFKAQANNVADIDAIWVLYDNGELTLNEARQQVLERANGIEEPEWVHARDRGDEESQVASYDGELSGIRVPRRSTRGGGAGVGFPQGDQGQARGGFTPSDLITDQDGNPVNLIQIFEKADQSTFLHESGHFWLEQLKSDAAAVGGQFQRDFDIVTKWWGSRSLEIKEEAIRRAKKKKDKASVAALQKMTDAQVKAYIRQGDLRGEGATRWLSIAMHEQFARGVESYFATGNAPSLALADAFASFAAWIQSVYRRLTGTDIQMSDEVTAVLDRMLAADEEIAVAQGQYELASIFDTADQSGMTNEQFNAYQEKIQRARRQSQANQRAKHISELQDSRRKWWQEERETYRDEVTNEIKMQPAYRLLHTLITGGYADGSQPEAHERLGPIDRSLLEPYLIENEMALSDLPRIGNKAVYAKGKDLVDPGTAARMFGFEDVHEMLQALKDLPKFDNAVNQALDKKMQELHGSMDMQGQEEATASVHGDHVAKVLAAELAALRTTQPAFKIKFIRAYAKGKLNQMKVSEVRPYKFLTAEKRHAKEAAQALKKGDRVAAYQHQFQRLVNHYLALEAMRAEKRLNAQRRDMKVYQNPKKKFPNIDARYVDAIKAHLEIVDFSAKLSDRRRALVELKAINQFIQEAEENDGAILQLPQWLIDDDTKENLNDMTYGEFIELYDSVKTLEKQGRLAKKLKVGQETKDRNEVIAEMKAALGGKSDALTTRLKESALGGADALSSISSGIAGLDASLLKAEFLLEALDGAPMGVWHQALYQPFADAYGRKNELTAAVTKLIQDSINEVDPEIRKGWGKQVDGKGLGTPTTRLTRENLIMLALNTGNESNLEKTIQGYADIGWNINEELLTEALDQLSKEEWDLVQSIWDEAEKLWPEVERIYRAEFGVSPDRVERRTVSTRHGEYAGGYFPMIYDYDHAGVKGRSASQKRTALEEMQGRAGQASVNSSMTKGRTGFNAPVNLQITRLTNGLETTIHYITHYDAVRNAKKILNDAELRAELERKVGIKYADLLDSWVGSIASNNQDMARLTDVETLAEKLIRNTTVAALGFSYTTLAAQTFGLTTAYDRLLTDSGYGPVNAARMAGYLAEGMRKALSSEHRNAVFQASAEMRFRIENTDRDLRENIKKLKGKDGRINRGLEFSMRSIAAMQLYTVDIPVWTAAYNYALAEDPANTDGAVAYADRVVRMSQSGGGAKDLAAVQRSRGLMKAATMFYSFFSALYAILRGVGKEFGQGVVRNPVGASMKAATRIFILITLQEAGSALLRGKLPEWEPEDEDEEGMAEFLAKRTAGGMLAGIPMARDIVTGLISDYGYSGSPAGMFGESIERLLKQAARKLEDGDETSWVDVAKPAVVITAVLTGKIPAIQINRTLDGLEALYEEEHNWRWDDLLSGYDADIAAKRD